MNDLQFMPHQEEVLNLTDDKNRCAYYLDMGLGKTFVGAEKMYLLNNTVNLIVCQKSKVDDWVDHMKTYYPEYRVMDLTKKSEGVNFRTLVETKDLYDQNIQIVGVINYDLVFRRKYIAHITDFTLLINLKQIQYRNLSTTVILLIAYLIFFRKYRVKLVQQLPIRLITSIQLLSMKHSICKNF